MEKNKNDISAWKGASFVLNNLGISVIGTLASVDLIPAEGTFNYGDAYLIGSAVPYDIWVYTRPGSFINIGPLSAVGPQGPQGPQGLPGEKGTSGKDGYAPVVRYASGLPSVLSSDKPGYLYVDVATNKLYSLIDSGGIKQWAYIITMTGPQGPQGPQGLQGATGTTLSIVNILNSVNELPVNFTSGAIPKNSAYLINGHLYIILGDQNDYNTWVWHDAGDFNLGSVLYKNGVFQYSADITNSADSNNGSLVTDIALNAVKSDLTAQLENKADTSAVEQALLGKQDTLAFDEEPTPESTNLLTSGAIAAALENYEIGLGNLEILARSPKVTKILSKTNFNQGTWRTDDEIRRGDYFIVVQDGAYGYTNAEGSLQQVNYKFYVYYEKWYNNLTGTYEAAQIGPASPIIYDSMQYYYILKSFIDKNTTDITTINDVDTTPTQDSTKFITSGGVYSAIVGTLNTPV